MVMSLPPITIITINRNSGAAAQRTANSIREQQQPFSWVIIDGASTDSSGTTLRDAMRSGDDYISEPDAGIADAFNKGIQRATGSALLFLNAGDTLNGPTALGTLVKAWNNGEHPWITGGAEVMTESGELLYVRNHHAHTSTDTLLRQGCRVWHAATLVDRRLIEKHGGYDTSFRIAMDYEMWLRFAAAGTALRIVTAPICQFRVGGISARVQARIQEDRRARNLHGFANSWFIEKKLSFVASTKAWLHPVAGPFLYRIKERLGW